jgi:predicted phosphodiesterase
MSDLHLEFFEEAGLFFPLKNPENADVLILAGDISTKSLSDFVAEATSHYPHVIFVAGNHEYYGHTPQKRQTELSILGTTFKNFHWLENDGITIDGQRFLGTTLWFQDKPMNVFRKTGMADFGEILDFEPWVYETNRKAMWFLDNNTTDDDIVITHHIPSFQGSHSRWRGSPLNDFFICNMESLIAEKSPKLWVYGHTHDSHDFNIGGTRLICNPFGYVWGGENPDFVDNLIVEV